MMDENNSNMLLTPSITENIIVDNPYPTNYKHRTLSRHRHKTLQRHKSFQDLHAADASTEIQQDDHINQIVDEIEEEINSKSNEGIILGAQFRQDTLKDLPENLTIKKLVKKRLNVRLQKSDKKISLWTQMKFSLSMFFSKCKSKLDDFLYEFELWYSTMKRIESEFGSVTATYFNFFRFLFLLNLVTMIFCLCLIAIPQISKHGFHGTESNSFQILDLFTGEGYLTDTFLYYGFYSNNSVSAINSVPYSMPRGYFYTMIVVYLGLFIIFALSMAKSYRRNFIETKGGLKNVYAQKIFCNWDFGIATENAARLKSSSIFYELKELMSEERKSRRNTNCVTYLLRLTIHMLVLVLLPAIGYAIWLELSNHKPDESEIKKITSALAINAVIYIVPIFMTLLCRLEDYKSSRNAFYLTLTRIFCLYAVVLGVLAYFWLSQLESFDNCWETALGQEVYRLIVFDFLFALIFFILEKLGLMIFALIKKSKVEKSEFKIVDHTLQLIYNQALFWLGLLFAPALSALIVIKYFILWYCHSYVEIKLSKPSKIFWRATHMQTWFLAMSFLTLMLMILVVILIIVMIKASECGPFGGIDGITYIYDFLQNEILTMEQGFLVWQILAYILKPGTVAVIFLSMIGFIYYLRAKAITQDKMINVIRQMIVVEAKDKEFLLKRIHMLSKDETK